MPPKKRWKKQSTSSNGCTGELEVGRTLSKDELQELALHKLTRHSLTIVELKRFLLEYSEDELLVDSITEHLTQCGYLNDQKFAEAFVRSGAEEKLRGRSRIEQELTRRGVDPSLVRSTMEEHCPSSQEVGRLSIVLERKLKMLAGPLDAKKLARLYNYLVRQGFSEESIRREMGRRFGDEHDFTS